MKCKKCCKEMKLLGSVRQRHVLIEERYVCPACGWRVSTYPALGQIRRLALHVAVGLLVVTVLATAGCWKTTYWPWGTRRSFELLLHQTPICPLVDEHPKPLTLVWNK